MRFGLAVRCLMSLLALASILCLAEAGVVIPVTVKDYTSRPIASHTIEVSIEGRSLYADLSGLTAPERCEIIYRGEIGTLFIVDRRRKVVSAYDGNIVDGLSSGVGFARETASRIIDALRGQPSRPRKQRIELKRTELKRYLQGRPCRAFFVFEDGRKLQEIWATSWKTAGIGKQDIQAARELLSYFSRVMSEPSFSKIHSQIEYIPGRELLKIDGFPVLIRHFGPDGIAYDISLGKPRRTDIDPSRFSYPKGFARKNGFAALLLGSS